MLSREDRRAIVVLLARLGCIEGYLSSEVQKWIDEANPTPENPQEQKCDICGKPLREGGNIIGCIVSGGRAYHGHCVGDFARNASRHLDQLAAARLEGFAKGVKYVKN